MSAKRLTGEELEVIRHLFRRGLTWDGNLPFKDCCTSLRDRGLVQYEFGFAWLTPEGEASCGLAGTKSPASRAHPEPPPAASASTDR